VHRPKAADLPRKLEESPTKRGVSLPGNTTVPDKHKERNVAILYVRNIPRDLQTAIRVRAKKNLRSMSAEVLLVLRVQFPTAKELRRRKAALKRLLNLRFTSTSKSKMPDSLEMLREDRER
jgi:plasmid stability protein